MSEYTPTTEEARSTYAAYQSIDLDGMLPAPTAEEAEAAFDRWHAAELAAAEHRGAEQAIRDAAERVRRTFTGETHYERLQEHADMIRDDEVDWRKPIDRIEEAG